MKSHKLIVGNVRIEYLHATPRSIMDMKRKNKFNLRNKIQMTASFMVKIVLVLAILHMAPTAFAASFTPFIDKDGNPDNYGDDGSEIILSYDNGVPDEKVNVVNRHRSADEVQANEPFDTWDTERNFGYTGDDYTAGSADSSVYYLGTFAGNDGLEEGENVDLQKLIQYFLGEEYTIEGYSKYDFDNNTNTDDGLTVSINDFDDEGDPKSGTWSVVSDSDDSEANKIDFYSVKGSNEFALYYVDPAYNSGTWTTAHVETNGGAQPGLSHFSVMRTFETEDPNVPPGAVPEPATMLLFGFSLMGLAGMARRRNSKF